MNVKKSLIFREPAFAPESAAVQSLRRDVENVSADPVLLRDPVFLALTVPGDFQTLRWYQSSWGREFCQQETPLYAVFAFENAKGRCSAQASPFFTLSGESGSVDFAICTSGNYRVEVTPLPHAAAVTIRTPNPDFAAELLPGETYHYPEILVHRYRTMTECYRTKQAFALSRLEDHRVYHELPLIYNHWWAYEDKHIDEETLLANARIARELGVEAVMLDAGWFGDGDGSQDWYLVRGDWDRLNRSRFPHGLAWLREQLADMGLRLGIWCELEGLGTEASLLKEHPEYAALRNGENLGCVCFASPAVQEWAYETMCRLFEQCGAYYWKLDFNLDPGLGCNAPGHGHGPGDGLEKHYEGLYAVLDRLRRRFPDLVIENCSSGGQRLNLEMGRHTHIHFLSDPDYSTHQMHQFTEASRWFLPRQLLHFMWSNTVTTNGSAPFPGLDLEALSPEEIRCHMRLAMLHQMGISHRLTEYSKRTLAVMKDCLAQYKEVIRPFVAEGTYLPLYLSENINIFSFTHKEESLLLLFAQEPGTARCALAPLTAERATEAGACGGLAPVALDGAYTEPDSAALGGACTEPAPAALDGACTEPAPAALGGVCTEPDSWVVTDLDTGLRITALEGPSGLSLLSGADGPRLGFSASLPWTSRLVLVKGRKCTGTVSQDNRTCQEGRQEI